MPRRERFWPCFQTGTHSQPRPTKSRGGLIGLLLCLCRKTRKKCCGDTLWTGGPTVKLTKFTLLLFTGLVSAGVLAPSVWAVKEIIKLEGKTYTGRVTTVCPMDGAP
ncbi:MAG: hypothetical protein CM1200mP20_01340 [Pseudomonadota bacterium]|nr:MAG: hypothetical protein CM1200mP20_01340 [Pseudomonadota bacterium]